MSVQTLPALVRQLRDGEGWSQRELATRAGVGPRAVWDLERGKATIRMDVVTRVLAVFGLVPGALPLSGDTSGAW